MGLRSKEERGREWRKNKRKRERERAGMGVGASRSRKRERVPVCGGDKKSRALFLEAGRAIKESPEPS